MRSAMLRSLRALPLLAVHMRELLFRIASAGCGARRERLGKIGEMGWRQCYIERAERFRQAVAASCADQRHDIASLRRHPGDGDLRRRYAEIVGNRAQRFHQRQVVVEIGALETWTPPA